MPGYVDCHTHLIFGESRVDEYVASFTMNKEEIKIRFLELDWRHLYFQLEILLMKNL